MPIAGTEPVRLSGEAGPGEAGLGMKLASRLDDSKCMERPSCEPAGVQMDASSVP